jgi:hypothetical protein
VPFGVTQSEVQTPKKADGGNTEHVDEEDGQNGVHETEAKYGRGECADRKRRDDHVRGKPHSAYTNCPIRVRSLVPGNAFNAALLDVEPSRNSLGLRNPGVTLYECVCMDYAAVQRTTICKKLIKGATIFSRVILNSKTKVIDVN